MKASAIFVTAAFLAANGLAHDARAQSPDQQDSAMLRIEQPRFSYWDEEQLEITRREIAAGNPYFVEHYKQLITDADRLLAFRPDPVVNKTTTPPSGDKRDYLSIAPYFWPDPAKLDGLPWLARDGRVNPATRGENTDHQRHENMNQALARLNLAYHLSGQRKYGAKILEIVRVWYLDPKTRVNPNIEFGQGIPGVNHGRPIGVIEWSSIRHVVTSAELLTQGGLMSTEEQLSMRNWLDRYADWLINSPTGRGEDVQPQNHGSWYDVQALTLLIHLGRFEEARRRAEAAKTNRIAMQIEPDGSMPRENRRTKSVNYNSMNREAFVHIARLARKVGVDLLAWKSDDGRSLEQSFRHLVPYATGQQAWTYEQIELGGAAPAIEIRMQPIMLLADDVLGIDVFAPEMEAEVAARIGTTDALSFPPKVMLGRR
jgi:hypothetical protein